MLFVLICVIGLTLFLVKGIPQLLVRAPQPVYAGYGTVEYLPLPSTTPDAYHKPCWSCWSATRKPGTLCWDTPSAAKRMPVIPTRL